MHASVSGEWTYGQAGDMALSRATRRRLPLDPPYIYTYLSLHNVLFVARSPFVWGSDGIIFICSVFVSPPLFALQDVMCHITSLYSTLPFLTLGIGIGLSTTFPKIVSVSLSLPERHGLGCRSCCLARAWCMGTSQLNGVFDCADQVEGLSLLDSTGHCY